jgi:hypothetical protein
MSDQLIAGVVTSLDELKWAVEGYSQVDIELRDHFDLTNLDWFDGATHRSVRVRDARPVLFKAPTQTPSHRTYTHMPHRRCDDGQPNEYQLETV